MPPAFPVQWQWEARLDTTNKRLAVALAISLVIHGLAYTGWRVAPAVSRAWKAAVERVFPRKFAELQPQPKTPSKPEEKPLQPKPLREVPMIFVSVDPALATPEPPKETPNYSTHNSVAANPEPKKLPVPKIDGTQKHVQRTVDNPKPQPKALEPAPTPVPEPKKEVVERVEKPPPVEKPAPTERTETKARPPVEVGDLAVAKPEPRTVPVAPAEKAAEQAVSEPPRSKPRTLREAMARNPALAGEKMQQEGGVDRHARVAMLDAKGTPFGNYDSVFIRMVQERWYGLLENNRFMLDRQGKVALTFRLHLDGRITRLESEENTVGEILGLLCQKAILDPAPFPKWPGEMRRMVGAEYRDVRFTFYYD